MEKEAERRAEAVLMREQEGVGPVTALALVLTVGPAKRFRNTKQVVSYLGLNPREHSSGGRQRLGSISKQGNGLLSEAAQTASQFDPELQRHYRRLKLRRSSGVS